MERIIAETRERGDREFVLEVIEQNEAGVRLYQKLGFESVRRLVGFTYDTRSSVTDSQQAPTLDELDLREMGRLILQFGLPDLPWQLSGETVAVMNPPARAYRNGPAYIAVSDPNAEHVVIWSLLVEPQARGNGLAVNLLKAVLANHPGKMWHVPAIWPEEFSGIFEGAGFQREELSQWQMRLKL
jgi:GNAT superfamily N-acetyltransferase